MKQKTTITDEIMNEVANLTEKELKEKGIFYLRKDTVFSVYPMDRQKLVDAQLKANTILIKKGVITEDMLKNDLNN